MNVISRTDNYIQRFLILRFNYPGATEVIDFDNQEITQDIGLGERQQVDIYKSAAGFATKIAKFQPKRAEITFRIQYPETIKKINKLIKYAGEKYTLDIFINPTFDWPATSATFQAGFVFQMRAVYEFSDDILYRLQARGKGITAKQELPFVFWEAADQQKADSSGVIVITTSDGRIYNLVTGSIQETAILPGGGITTK